MGLIHCSEQNSKHCIVRLGLAYEPGDEQMKKVAIVTDSSASLPAGLAQDLGIRVVPIMLVLNGYSFHDGVDITPGELYRLLRSTRHVPTTSAPSVGDFLRVYATAAETASGIVSIHMSQKLSATHTSARAASQLVDDVPIRVLDSGTAAMGQGFVVLAAARAAAEGADLETVVARAQNVASRVHLLATIGTLEYLHRGGRIGGAATLLGTALQIKPVLYLADGHVDVFAKPRTQSKAAQVMLRQISEQADGHQLHVAIFHADAPEEAEELRKTIAQQFRCAELYVTEMTPVMGAHTGTGVLGVVFYADEQK
jgi:DegV family protein with EDD domain